MHYFESQLVSTTKVVEQNDGRVRFCGHYMYGDGFWLFSTPVLVFILSVALQEIEFINMLGVIGVTAIFTALILPVLVFRKHTELRANRSGVFIKTRMLFAEGKKEYPCSQISLEVAHIHIRTATDCGAIDLVLPNGKIRLLVDGKYERALQKAEELSQFTGIVLARPPKA